MSSEPPSSFYASRPILPLPKRRLRERLTSDAAKSIDYPPPPQPTAPLFLYPYSLRESLSSDRSSLPRNEPVAEPAAEPEFTAPDIGFDEPLMGHYRRSLVAKTSQEQQTSDNPRASQRPAHDRRSNVQPPSSTSSSADGYDSFENSNNKKKRKIPTTGESVLGGVHALNDAGALGVPSPPTTGDEGSGEFPIAGPAATYYQSGGSLVTSGTQGISGPGRGRYGRVRNGRSPLRVR